MKELADREAYIALNLMERVGHLDWEIEIRTKALFRMVRSEYAPN